MKTIGFLALLILALPAAFAAADSFVVKSVAGGSAVLSGDASGLKAGDVLYYARSPFRFTVTDVKPAQVTIAVPGNSDLKPDAVLLRSANSVIQNNMETEQTLKRALED
jgi:hypothetical protein